MQIKKLYHCTKRENLPHILSHGLVPSKPSNIRDAVEGVYLSKLPFDWMHYVTDETTEAGAMIEIDATNLRLTKDNGIGEDDYKKHPAYICKDVIPIDRFLSVSISTKSKPWEFKPLEKEQMEKIRSKGNKREYARAILEFYKRNHLRFHTTKYADEIEMDGRLLTHGEVGKGVVYAHKHGCMKRISNTRWEILSYDLDE